MKYVLYIFLLLTSAVTISAENSISFGSGINFTAISGGDSLIKNSYKRLGSHFKLGFQHDITRHFSVVTGLSLENRGEENNSLREVDSSLYKTTSEKINILNLQLPVLAQVNFPFSIFCVNLFAGPELGIFLSGDKNLHRISYVAAFDTFPAYTIEKTDTLDFSRNMKMLEFGINAGIGIEIKTGKIGAFFVKPGIYLGLTDILAKDLGNDTTVNLSGKHSTIYLTVGYKFNAKPKKDTDKINATKENIENDRESKKTDGYPSNLDQYNNYNSHGTNDSSTRNERSYGSGSLNSNSESDSTLE